MSITVPALGFMVAPAFVNQHPKSVDLGPIDALPGGPVHDRDVPPRSDAGRGVAADCVHPQQRRRRRQAELHDHLEPVRAPRLPRAAERADLRDAEEGREDGSRPAGDDHPHAAGRLRLSVPRRSVRHGGKPHRRPARPRARSLRVQHRQRPPRPARRIQRGVRRRRRRCGARSTGTSSPTRASTSTASSPCSTRFSRRADGDDAAEEAGLAPDPGRELSARLARGALGPRRRNQVLPVPQGSAATSPGTTRSARRR